MAGGQAHAAQGHADCGDPRPLPAGAGFLPHLPRGRRPGGYLPDGLRRIPGGAGPAGGNGSRNPAQEQVPLPQGAGLDPPGRAGPQHQGQGAHSALRRADRRHPRGPRGGAPDHEERGQPPGQEDSLLGAPGRGHRRAHAGEGLLLHPPTGRPAGDHRRQRRGQDHPAAHAVRGNPSCSRRHRAGRHGAHRLFCAALPAHGSRHAHH